MTVRNPRYSENKTAITTMPVPDAVWKGKLPEVQPVLLDSILFDESYQRPVNEAKAQTMARAWEEMAAGLILLSRRGGNLYCYDGRTRHRACEINGYPYIAAAIYDGLSVHDEARLFVRCNYERGLPKTFTVFRARLRALDPVALDIMSVLNELGIRIATAQTTTRRHPGEIWALGLCEKLYRLGGRDGLKFALGASLELWPGSNHNMAQYVLAGVFRFGYLYHGRAIHDWTRHLEGTDLDALLEDAYGFARLKKTSVGVGFGRVILEAYNRHHPRNPLPDEFKKGFGEASPLPPRERPALSIELGLD